MIDPLWILRTVAEATLLPMLIGVAFTVAIFLFARRAKYKWKWRKGLDPSDKD